MNGLQHSVRSALAGMQHLNTLVLKLSYNNISNASVHHLAAIAGMQKLTSPTLELGFCGIGDGQVIREAGARHLSSFAGMQELTSSTNSPK